MTGETAAIETAAEEILSKVDRQQVRYVLLGASAGAIEALGQVLPALPAKTSIAVLVVVHLPSDRNSLLTSIFQAKCALEVIEPNDKQNIEPAHLYFAPPGYHMLVECDRVLSLSTDSPVHYSRPSIDVLFESAADAIGSQSLGIILTGANCDGASGLRALLDKGGIGIVQNPSEAEAAMMPQSALERCPEATILTLAQIANLFQRL